MRALVFFCVLFYGAFAVAHQKMIYATPAATLWIRSSVPCWHSLIVLTGRSTAIHIRVAALESQGVLDTLGRFV